MTGSPLVLRREICFQARTVFWDRFSCPDIRRGGSLVVADRPCLHFSKLALDLRPNKGSRATRGLDELCGRCRARPALGLRVGRSSKNLDSRCKRGIGLCCRTAAAAFISQTAYGK